MKAEPHDSPDRTPDIHSGRAVKTADKEAQERKLPAKKAKKEKAKKLPVLTHNFTHTKILNAQKRLLKGLKRREEKARARVKQLGSLKEKKIKAEGVEGS